MDIHPPEGPAHSLRDFATHIAIVTVGILIALSLEGVRETFRERRVVREARESFRQEAEDNRKNMVREKENMRRMSGKIDAILKDMPELAQHPEQIWPRVVEVQPYFYFFSSSRWESALSTGALGHMDPAEVDRYANANILVHSYTSLEAEAIPLFIRALAFFSAHRHPTGAEIEDGVEKLTVLKAYLQTMTGVGGELAGSLEEELAKR